MLLLAGGNEGASPEHPQTVRRVGGLARLTRDGHNGWLEGGGVGCGRAGRLGLFRWGGQRLCLGHRAGAGRAADCSLLLRVGHGGVVEEDAGLAILAAL
eukprot:407496-Prorocentrum_minimum.AAC.2